MLMTLEVAGDGDIPATDLGFLLHKHPDRVQDFPTSQGKATVVFPVATAAVCQVAVRIDGVGARIAAAESVNRYVNTVPYAASSRLLVALGKVFGEAVAGRCKNRPELVSHRWPMVLTVYSVPIGGKSLPREVFEPLGWTVDVEPQPLTPPQWGESGFVTVRLRGTQTVTDALRHVSVGLVAVTGAKHYFVDELEIDKLIKLGDGWLETHPAREAIVGDYVKQVRSLSEEALIRIDGAPPVADTVPGVRSSLAYLRRQHTIEVLSERGARSVLDIGCGEGKLLAQLMTDLPSARVAGVDTSADEVTRARARLERWHGVQVWQSSLAYIDPRCRGFDAAVLMEVIEHIDGERLPQAMASVFGDMAPRLIVVTTPNAEYNVRYGLEGLLRHPDHRFEFTRAEFTRWCASIAADHRYRVEFSGIGEVDNDLGTPTQCAVFTRIDEEELR